MILSPVLVKLNQRAQKARLRTIVTCQGHCKRVLVQRKTNPKTLAVPRICPDCAAKDQG